MTRALRYERLSDGNRMLFEKFIKKKTLFKDYWSSKAKDGQKSYIFLCVDNQNNLMGVMTCKSDIELGYIFVGRAEVMPEGRRKGIATGFLGVAARRAVEDGIQVLKLKAFSQGGMGVQEKLVKLIGGHIDYDSREVTYQNEAFTALLHLPNNPLEIEQKFKIV